MIGYEEIKDNEVRVESDLETSRQYIDQVLHIPSINIESSSYVPLSNRNYMRENDDIKLFAFYLTQYHPTTENDKWWG
ncbi:MAG: glycoside hydrolase family 99-like domain-containing protein, partial [Clostridium sp.]|nr:glycoside hydrolase family 99-like domain-containing protein [Clostridium sp.]